MFCCLADEKIKLKVLACSFEITILTNFKNLAHFAYSQCVAFVEDDNNQLNWFFFTGSGTDALRNQCWEGVRLIVFYRFRDGRSPPPAPGGASD